MLGILGVPLGQPQGFSRHHAEDVSSHKNNINIINNTVIVVFTHLLRMHEVCKCVHVQI